MAMKKTAPKPPRPGATGKTGSTALGARKGTKVTKITKVTKPMTKSVVRNPSAPKGTGSGAPKGAVRVITPGETFMKKGKAQGMNSTKNKNGAPAGRGGVTPKKYKQSQSDKIRKELKISPYKNRRPGATLSNLRGGMRGGGGGFFGGRPGSLNR